MQRDSEDRDAAENEETHARPSPRGPLPETHTYAHAHAQISPVNPASLRAHGPILILVLVALAAVLVRQVRTIQLLAFVPIDPAQAREVERERLVELGLACRVKRLAARSLARPPVTGTGTEQRKRKRTFSTLTFTPGGVDACIRRFLSLYCWRPQKVRISNPIATRWRSERKR